MCFGLESSFQWYGYWLDLLRNGLVLSTYFIFFIVVFEHKVVVHRIYFFFIEIRVNFIVTDIVVVVKVTRNGVLVYFIVVIEFDNTASFRRIFFILRGFIVIFYLHRSSSVSA